VWGWGGFWGESTHNPMATIIFLYHKLYYYCF
jgi:hypothetical protein